MSKILFVVGLSKNGGAEKRAIRTASLIKDSYESLVFAFAGKKEDGIDCSFADSYSDYKQSSLKQRIQFLSKYITKEKPDVVVSFLPHINFLTTKAIKKSGLKNIKHIVAIAYYKFGFKNKLLLRYSFRNCDVVYYQCQKQKELLKCKKTSFVIANPIPIPELKKKQYSFKFMSVGRLEEQKDYVLQINSFRRIVDVYPEATLDIFGSGSQKTILNDLISNLHLNNNVFIHEYTDNIDQEFQKHDIFLFTTKGEGFPNVLAEAMANNLICFSTYFLTGCEDLIEDGKTGFIINERDPEKYASVVCKQLDNYENCKDVAKNGHYHVKEKCDLSVFEKQFSNEINKLLK